MEIHQSCRQNCPIRVMLQGVSGSGKTMSALLIAQGLVAGNWAKVFIIDSENGSADLYAGLGCYRVLTLTAPYTPERYIQAIEACEQAGAGVIIIDSISHCWEHLVDYHARLPGNSFTTWSKVTPRHTAFVNRILRSSAHTIATVRSKAEYVISDKNGKKVPEKVGMKIIQRDGIEYEFSVVLEMDLNHYATASKDRTQMFSGTAPFRPGQEAGTLLREWSQLGLTVHPEQVHLAIGNCQTIAELLNLYQISPSDQQAEHKSKFQSRKQQLLEKEQAPSSIGNNQLFTQPNPKHGNLAHQG